MGTKYTTVSISGYNSSPPSDDGAQTSANKVKWSTVKTKLGDPVKDAVTSINSQLVAHFDAGPEQKTASYTTVAADYGKVLEITTAVTVTLLAAATAGDGYHLTVKNSASGALTVASGDNIDGNASLSLAADNSVGLITDGSTYYALPGRGIANPFTTRGDTVYQGASAPTRLPVGTTQQALMSDGTDPKWGDARGYRPDGGIQTLSGGESEIEITLNANEDVYVRVWNIDPSADDRLCLRTYESAAYVSGASDYRWGFISGVNGSGEVGDADATSAEINLTSSATEGGGAQPFNGAFTVEVINGNNASHPTQTMGRVLDYRSSANIRGGAHIGSRNANAAATKFKLFWLSGATFDSASYEVFRRPNTEVA